MYSGGLRYTPHDPVQSAIARRYAPLESAVFTGQTPNCRRLDLRIAWRFNRTHLSGNLNLDIQNALNQTNAGYVAYDPVHNTTFIEYRGELIPVLAFQVDF